MHSRATLLPILVLLTGCGEASTPGQTMTEETSQSEGTMADCPVIESVNWKAWINAMPGPEGPRLHVTGDVTLPTPGYTANWTVGAMDKAMPPGLTLKLAFTPPEGFVTQVLTTLPVTYIGEAVYDDYRVIRVTCDDTLLAEIAEIETAH